MTTELEDRRSALKRRHRDAILLAARELVEERGTRFTVDELAERADVARRTVFNHFDSLEDVMLTVSADQLAVIVDDFVATAASGPVGDGSLASIFGTLAAGIRATDLPPVIAQVAQTLGGWSGAPDPRGEALTRQALGRVTTLLTAEVRERSPHADDLDIDLLIGTLMQGVIVIATRWASETGAVLDDAGRARWTQLVETLLERIRSGYAPTPPTA